MRRAAGRSQCSGLLAVAFAATLAACSSFRGASTVEGADVNSFPANYKSELLAFLQTYLNDPTNVRDAQIAEPAIRSIGSSERYVVCLKYNAKNGEGRYLGLKDSMAVYLRGRFNQFVNATGGETCKTAVYQPFPELESLKR